MEDSQLKNSLKIIINNHIARLSNILENQSKLILEKNSLLKAKQSIDRSMTIQSTSKIDCEKQVQEKITRIQELTEEIRENKKSNEKNKQLEEQLKEQLKVQTNDIVKLLKAKENIVKELKKMKIEKEVLDKQIEEKNLEIKTLKTEKKLYESQLKVSKEENESKLKEIERLKESLKEFGEGKNVNQVKEAQINSLREELKKKTSELIERTRVYDTMISQVETNDSEILQMFKKFESDSNVLFDKAESELQFSTTSAEAVEVSALTKILENASTDDNKIINEFEIIMNKSKEISTGLVLEDIKTLIDAKNYTRIPSMINNKTTVLKERCFDNKKKLLENEKEKFCNLIKLFEKLRDLINVVISQSNLQNTKKQIEKEIEKEKQKSNEATSSMSETENAKEDDDKYYQDQLEYYRKRQVDSETSVSSDDSDDEVTRANFQKKFEKELAELDSGTESESEHDVATETETSSEKPDESISNLKNKIEKLISAAQRKKRYTNTITNPILNNLTKYFKDSNSTNLQSLKNSIKDLIDYSKFCDKQKNVSANVELQMKCHIREKARLIIIDIDKILNPQLPKNDSDETSDETSDENMNGIEQIATLDEQIDTKIQKIISINNKIEINKKKKNWDKSIIPFGKNTVFSVIQKFNINKDAGNILVDPINILFDKVAEFCSNDTHKGKNGYNEYCEMKTLLGEIKELLNTQQNK